MAVKTRKWDEIYNNLDSLTQEDRDEIALKVKIIGQILDARKEKGLTQAELEAIDHYFKIAAPIGNDSGRCPSSGATKITILAEE